MYTSNALNFSLQRTQTQAEQAALQIKRSINQIFCSTDFIPSSILWTCLIDPSYDTVLLAFLNDPIACEQSDSLSIMIDLKRNLIAHLTTVVILPSTSGSKTTIAVFNNNETILRQYTARCLRLTSFLLLKLKSIHNFNINFVIFECLSALTSEYLRLLRVVLMSRIELRRRGNRETDDFGFFFCLYLTIIGSTQPLDDAIDFDSNGKSFKSKHFKLLQSAFENHIGIHPSIDAQLLEILSIFSARFESNVLHYMMDAHWKATFQSNYDENSQITYNPIDAPFTLKNPFESTPRLTPEGNRAAIFSEEWVPEPTARLMTGCLRRLRNRFLAHSMCRHFGLIALSPYRIDTASVYIGYLLDRLAEYINGANEDLKAIASTIQQFEGSSDDDEDAEYIPPSNTVRRNSKLSIPPLDDFACLTTSSYPVFFEMLLRTIVSSVALFSLPQIVESLKDTPVLLEDHHPVNKLTYLLFAYGSLINLYKEKKHMFPKILLNTVIHISKSMLDIALVKVEEYVKWRNSLPIENATKKRFNLSSVIFLKKLLDSMGQNLIGALRHFTFEYSYGLSVSQDKQTKQVRRDQEIFFCTSALPRLKSLSQKVEKSFSFLRRKCSQYDIGDLKVHFDKQTTLRPMKKLSVDLELGYLESDESTTCLDESTQNMGLEVWEKHEEKANRRFFLQRSRKRSVDATLSVGRETGETDSDESLFEESSSSEAFIVNGNWGQFVSEEDSESDRSRSIQEIKITR